MANLKILYMLLHIHFPATFAYSYFLMSGIFSFSFINFYFSAYRYTRGCTRVTPIAGGAHTTYFFFHSFTIFHPFKVTVCFYGSFVVVVVVILRDDSCKIITVVFNCSSFKSRSMIKKNYIDIHRTHKANTCP